LPFNVAFENKSEISSFFSSTISAVLGGDASELSNVLELVTDAWNYFPHKVLGGISPAEKLLESK